MFEDRDEAIEAMTPKLARQASEDANVPDAESYKQLCVAGLGCILHVTFVGEIYDSETLPDIRQEFDHLAKQLSLNSKVLIDFTGVNTFDADSIETLATFKKRLRNKGSRVVLCSLSTSAITAFFAAVPTPRRN